MTDLVGSAPVALERHVGRGNSPAAMLSDGSDLFVAKSGDGSLTEADASFGR